MGVVIPLDESKNKQASIKPLVDLTKADMERVNQLILAKAGSDVQMIPEVANHLISSGGKRLRPMLTIATANMFGYRGDAQVKLAASVAHYAELLRHSYWTRGQRLDEVVELARAAARGFGDDRDVAELVNLVNRAASLESSPRLPTPTERRAR